MDTVHERTVARGRGVIAERDLAESAADFYLLETLSAEGNEEAARKLSTLEERLASEFAIYLDLALGGELRYARRHLGEEALPRELVCFFRETCPGHRGKAWLVWSVVRRSLQLRALELAEDLFSDSRWRENFGGSPWAGVARLLRQYLEGDVSRRIFVDQCFSIQHNSGSVFNKLFDTRKLASVLIAQSKDDYEKLLVFASYEVSRRWRLREWRRRQDHDPVWLGVQILDTFDEIHEEGVAS